MKDAPILVVGATGATGRRLVDELLQRGETVRAIVRSTHGLPDRKAGPGRLELFHGNLLEMSEAELTARVAGCRAVLSCLGHNLTFKGIFGPPHRLVTEAARRLCEAIRATAPERPVRYVLMNTSGNRNRDLDEPVSLAESCVVGLLRILVPPHADNEAAADYLRTEIGPKDGAVEWTAVRPDTLIDEDTVTPYEVHASPIRSAIFNAGRTSRINVAHFMASLATEDDIWQTWKGRMPVIYNKAPSKPGS